MKKLFLLSFLACAACSQSPAPVVAPLTVTKTVYVPYVFPEALTKCPENPAPGDWTHESGVVKYMIRLQFAADTCRNTLTEAVQAATQATAPAAK